MSKQPFLTDVATLRKRAREHIDQGAVTPGYGGDTQTAIRVLNEALATEIICVLRYRRHYFMARGIHAGPVAAEFLEHATEEQAHADLVAERIAIDSYREIAAFFAPFDATSRRLMEQIQAKEEEHADDLADLLTHLPAKLKN